LIWPALPARCCSSRVGGARRSTTTAGACKCIPTARG
jgi:hypothetical protein